MRKSGSWFPLCGIWNSCLLFAFHHNCPKIRLVRTVYIVTALTCFFSAFGISASAQVTITSPTAGSTVSMPAWLRAHASSCNGSTNMTAFGYSIGNSALITWGKTNYDIDTTDFRLTSQSSTTATQYTIHFKAWSDAGACPDVPVVVYVNGPATSQLNDVNTYGNGNWNQQACPTPNNTSGVAALNWFWQWDSGTAQCTFNDTNTYYPALSGSPSIDGKTRTFYLDWQYKSGQSLQNPGERYSFKFGTNATGAKNFVYDTYIYLASPQNTNIEAIQMDTNQVWDANGDVLILGLECVHTPKTWKFTTNVGGQDTWNTPNPPGQTALACDPQSWTPNTWHHLQLAGHRFQCTDGTWGCASYDSITFDGTTNKLTGWNGNSSFAVGWTPGDLILNFQVDGVDNNGNEATAIVYVDGMTMIWW